MVLIRVNWASNVLSCLVLKNVVKASWFQNPYCGPALGYAKEHLSSEAYVRCLFCCRDVKVMSRGITTFLEHCQGVRHHRLDCLYRMERGLRLRSRSGALLPDDEAAELRATLTGVTMPQIEELPRWTVAEVLAMEQRGENVWLQVAEDDRVRKRSLRMFVVCVLDCLYRDGDVASVVSLWESLVSSNSQYGQLMGMNCTADTVLVSINVMSSVLSLVWKSEGV